MRTLVQGGWVVGFDGQRHELLRDGVVVYEDDRILHVGQRFEGRSRPHHRRARHAGHAGVR